MGRSKRTTGKNRRKGTRNQKAREDESAFGYIALGIQRIKLPPMINLPVSGIKRISLWAILSVSFVGGCFSGFLGGGAGYILLPALVYLLRVTNPIALATHLFHAIT